jgi:hypothetical protein
MNSKRKPRIIGLASALLIALFSVLSAAHMVPDRNTVAMESYLALGGDIAELCGDISTDHSYDCPLCRLLPDPPCIGPKAPANTAELRVSWPRLADLTQSPAPDGPGLARAPPHLS